ncbi:MAG: hypothetical protein AABZ63_05695, partial [Actinomycetota bacterium]
AEALKVLLAEPPEIRTDHMIRVTANIWEQMKAIRTAVRHQAKVAFEDIVGDADRVTQAVTFFALLEMYNSGELEVEQEQLFGRILIYAAEKSNKLIA